MTSLTRLSEFVAGETTTLIYLRQEPVPAVDERIDRVVAPRPLVVAPFTGIGLMTHGTIHPVHRRHSPMQIVAPSDRMRLRAHHRVTLIATAVGQWALFGSRYRLKDWSKTRHEFMTEGALGVGRASDVSVPNPECCGMVARSFG